MEMRYEERLYNKGYRVSKEGVVANPKGRVIKSTKTDAKGRKIPKISFRLDCGKKKDIRAARLQAYQKFGDELYKDNNVVVVNNDDITDISYDNISLGINGQNLDKDRPNGVKTLPMYDKNAVFKFHYGTIGNRMQGNSYKQTCAVFGMSKSTLHNILKQKDSKYRTLGEFKQCNPEAYKDAKEQDLIPILTNMFGWDDELESYWTQDRCIRVAKYHKSKNKWKRCHPFSFKVANKNEWVTKINKEHLKPIADELKRIRLELRESKDDPNYNYEDFLKTAKKFKYHFNNVYAYKRFVIKYKDEFPEIKKNLPHIPKNTFPSKGKTNNEIFQFYFKDVDEYMSLEECREYALESMLITLNDWEQFFMVRKNSISNKVPNNPIEHFALKELNQTLFENVPNQIIASANHKMVDGDILYIIKDSEGKFFGRFNDLTKNNWLQPNYHYNNEFIPINTIKSSVEFRWAYIEKEEVEFMNAFMGKTYFDVDELVDFETHFKIN